MDIRKQLQAPIRAVQTRGFEGVKRIVVEPYIRTLGRVEDRFPLGRNVLNYDWDLLIILDGCRADIMHEVVDEFNFLTTHSARSVGGGSNIWMERTFTDDHIKDMSEITYITANPFSDQVLNYEKFNKVEEIWRHGWDSDLGTVPPRNVTDMSVKISRDNSTGRLIAHYMQPHHPFIPDPKDGGINKDDPGDPNRSVWSKLIQGEIGKEEVWKAYRENLTYVLNDVELLLENIDAENVLITADHGNGFGEWGIYGHGKFPTNSVRKVPWIWTTAADTGNYTPQFSKKEPADESVTERLKSLGYKQ